MKTLRQTILFLALFLPATLLQAQTIDYLAKAREFLDNGNCEGAQACYGLYRNTNSADSEIETAIAVCRAIQEQEEKYNKIVASYEKALQELRATESAKFDGMKTVYEALLSDDCDKAYQAYLECHIRFGLEDAGLENQIKACQREKAEKEKPRTNEKIFEVGNLEYYVYLKGIKMAWTAANDAAKVSKEGDHSDWRVPTVAELQIVLQQIDEKTYEFSKEGHWSSDMTLYNDGSGKCYYVYDKTRVESHYVQNKIPSGLCYCILVRTKKMNRK